MATVNEVTQMIDYISAAMSLGPDKQLKPAAVVIYCELLGDLPADALMIGAKIVVLNRKYASFPQIAEIREAAVASARGEVVAMPPADAWGIAWRIAGNTDPDERDWDLPGGSFDRAVKRAEKAAGRELPEVVAAMHKFGLHGLIFTAGASIESIRAQFMRSFEQLAAADRERQLLPPKLVDAIESGSASGPATLPMPAVEALKRIGVEG